MLYKPYIFNIVLVSKFKLWYFKNKRLLYYYSSIANDIRVMLKYKFIKLKSEIKPKSINYDFIFQWISKKWICY